MSNVTPMDQRTHRTPHPRRCRAHKRDGSACGRWAIAGGTVCPSHGGRAPQVRSAAQLRLADLVMPALTTIAREMATSPISAVRLRAAQDLLDRAGIARGGDFLTSRENAFDFISARLAVLRGEIDA